MVAVGAPALSSLSARAQFVCRHGSVSCLHSRLLATCCCSAALQSRRWADPATPPFIRTSAPTASGDKLHHFPLNK